MRIVSFNVQHARTPAGPVDVAALGRYGAGLAVDVLGLQEVDDGVPRSGRRDQAGEVAVATGLAVAFGPALGLTLGGRYGNALLVRGALGDVENRPLPRRGRREPRSVLVATAETAEGPVSVAVTHLSADRDEAPAQLAAAVAALVERPRPWVLLGDLNMGPERVAPTLAGHGLVLARPQDPTFPADAPRARIDHVAVSGLDILGVEVAARAPVSDHRALVVTTGRRRSPPP